MRLEHDELVAIKAAALRTFGEEVAVYLYGSRVDDAQRGGDIDLLIEVPQPQQATYEEEFNFRHDLESMLGERRIDILLRCHTDPLTAIQDLAMSTGIRLL